MLTAHIENNEIVITGKVKENDNYPGYCCKGYDWTVSVIFYYTPEKPEDSSIWGQCHNRDCHNEEGVSNHLWVDFAEKLAVLSRINLSLKNMTDGDKGYVRPGALFKDEKGQYYIDGNFTLNRTRKVNYKIKIRKDNGWYTVLILGACTVYTKRVTDTSLIVTKICWTKEGSEFYEEINARDEVEKITITPNIVIVNSVKQND